MFECVFLASGLDGANKGGIQYSARLAWDAVRAHCQGQSRPAALLSYGEELAAESENDCRIVGARSRFAGIAKALLYDWTARRVLCWHSGVAKLLPFLRPGAAHVSVFLHGIEAWRPLSAYVTYCLRRADQFIANSSFTWKRFVEYNPTFAAAPHRVVDLGIGELADETHFEPCEPPAALMLGRLMRSNGFSKGHRELIAAWPRVRQRMPGAQLWIAGAGDLRPELERLAREMGCGDSVKFWGRVSEEAKEDLLRRCRCLALPSRGEGFGLVYLEAMRLGRPCLVSRQDAGREVVHPPEAGLAASVDNPDELTEALVKLLSGGPVWEEWSVAARRRYATRYTGAQFQARLLEAVFQEPARVPVAAR
jgi:phosphatidylinositol alpha-1,6-mannosyltransferase